MKKSMHKVLALILALAAPAAAVERSAPVGNLNLNLPSSSIKSGGMNGLSTLPAVSIPVLSVPSAQIPAVTAPNAVEAAAQAVAPQIEAIARPDAGAEASASAGGAIQQVLQGGKAGELAPAAVFAAPGEGSGGSGLSGGGSNDGGSKLPDATAANASVQTRAGYTARRRALASIAGVFGMTFSLPVVGDKLAAEVLREASTKTAMFSDIDDTLGAYNKVGAVLSQEMAASIVALRKAGKFFAAVTDRGDFPNPKSSQKGAVESFETIPAAERAGIILATNGGGKIYEYDAQGVPQLIFEEPKLDDDSREKIKASAEVVKAKLESLGAALQPHDPVDPSKPYTPEFHNPYGYGMILKAGTPEASVKAVAAAMQAEMAARGLEFEVEGRMAKDATLPPYITFSKINKTVAVRNIARLKGIKAGDAVAIGDSMYKPVDKPRGSQADVALARAIGEELSGGPMPVTGNATDANMEKGLPGMLTLSVGGSATPEMENGYVMPGKGADVSKSVIDAMASNPVRPQGGASSPLSGALMTLLLVALAVGSWTAMYYAIFRSMAGVTIAPGNDLPF